ncbi:MAG: hypothetical protein SFU53_01530 [Terrimicrobiaceae bacterium]|nr:hypothetical protein [Terrimicrobiaceae bacterium]
MRTTLTLDDDLAGILKKRSREFGRPFKEVVNSALRKGLQEELPFIQKAPPKVRSRALGLLPGYDPDRMNQLVDELEAEEFLRKEPGK